MNKTVTIKDLIREANGTLIQGDENLAFENWCKDTRTIQPGQIHIGIKGESFNGSLAYEEALKKGAAACLLQDVEPKKEILEKYPNATIVTVENVEKALQQIANYKRSLYNIPVVGITGSVGKTSTKDMVASVVKQEYNVHKTMGNYNSGIGLPLTILDLRDEKAMVLEMGMSNLGEISLLTNIAKPDVAVITNVGTAHIGNLGSRENILKAKLEILEGLKPNGTVIINYDNDLLHNWYEKEKNNYNIITYGTQEGSNILGKNAVFKENGTTCEAIVDGKTYNVFIPIGGEHFVSNSLCALAVAKALGIKIEKAIKGISEFELTKKRMEIKKSKNGATVINDCYNANYDSMKAALKYLGNLSNKRKIAVLGDMLELGEYSKDLHEKVGEEVAANHVDMLICVGEEAKYIAQKAEEKGIKKENIYLFKTNEEVISMLEKELKENDVVLLKASNGMNFTQICESIC